MTSFETYADDEAGLTRDEIHSTMRRLFVASMVTALVMAVGAGLMAMAPASHSEAQRAAQRFALVQQPIFVDQGAVASKQSGIELP